ncbi:MAG: Hsp70 family protein [Bacteroidota bacterium]
MASYHKVIGIDLGTTFSVVAAYDFEKQDIKVIPNRQNHTTTPSVVYLSPNGEVSIGRSAKQKQVRDPNGVLIEVKRLMGEKGADGNKSMVEVHGRKYDPEFISAWILKELKKNAEKYIGAPIHDCVITVPAYFKESQKNATREAAKIAKLNPRLIINEPTAAAVAYGLDSEEVQSFIVYDFGGGTFDVSIISVEEENTVEVLGTGGNAQLGGGDIDQILLDWLLNKMKEQFGKDFTSNKKLVGRLRLKAEEAKINLCNEQNAQEVFLENPFEGVEEISYQISVEEFERLINPLLEKTFKEVDVALKSAEDKHDLSMDDIEAFILVGGSSKIPAVRRLLEEKYKKEVKSDLNPDEIVAIGAAMMGKNYDPSLAAQIKDDVPLEIAPVEDASREVNNTNIKDVVSHTLGVGLVDDIYDPLIPKDSIIPHKVQRKGYTTAEDNQTSIYVPVFQGENKKASLNFMLGDVVISGLRPEPKGTHQFEITFALDADGIFFGEIKHLQTGETKTIKLDRGMDAMTEKKRMDLSEMVESGKIAPISNGSDQGGSQVNITDIVQQAYAIMSQLPPDKKQELQSYLMKLQKAQVDNDPALATHIISMTTFLTSQSL